MLRYLTHYFVQYNFFTPIFGGNEGGVIYRAKGYGNVYPSPSDCVWLVP